MNKATIKKALDAMAGESGLRAANAKSQRATMVEGINGHVVTTTVKLEPHTITRTWSVDGREVSPWDVAQVVGQR